ncbi:hypothetical protein Pmani_033779 [Petrolisthes manimaculis]|uniref:C-type lectin domain-containing protein n=1 Tax=Petrolisthes manimaculis TaxID=1843537 RepID=A0AAE1NQD7_9EUCA|nr:hypothetical protein Pmani_033779 [Petrolisthes manimaculis]
MESTLDWQSARTLCQDLGGDLAKISTGRALRQAYAYIKAYALSGTFWLGGGDQVVEGDWVWVYDGTRVDKGTPYWAINTGLFGNSHEPSGGSDENCLAMAEDRFYFFTDRPCTESHHPICME